MRLAVTPTGVERAFAPHQIIVTKTDPRGRITYANDVFLRVSAYTEDEVLGRAHNVIRHPDMPRGLFAFLWERISSGGELFGYVQNLAGDGAHYWVLAHVTPTVDAAGVLRGYHSNRRYPSREAVAAIEPVYARMRAAELDASGPAEAATAGRQVLADLLAERGRSYDEWIWTLTTTGTA